MKKLILFLLLISFGYGQTRTSVMQLPQWSAGDTLRAGTKNERDLSNFGLNNGFARLDYILGQASLDSAGRFSVIKGEGTGELIIDAGNVGADASTVNIADSLFVNYNATFSRDVLVENNLHVGGYISTDSTISEKVLTNYISGSTSDTTHFTGYTLFDYAPQLGVPNDNGGAIWFADGSSSYKFGLATYVGLTGTRTGLLPNRSGIFALQTGNDSIQAPTVHAVLFNSPMVSGVSLNDSAGNFQEWSTNATAGRTIVRLKYVHKAGIKNVVLRGQFKTSPNDWAMTVYVGSISNGETGSSGTYESGVVTLDVSGLTPNTTYDLTAKLACVISGTAYAKELIITAESN